MALQKITPINDQLADIIVRADEPWIETEPGMAWIKVLWTGAETGCAEAAVGSAGLGTSASKDAGLGLATTFCRESM